MTNHTSEADMGYVRDFVQLIAEALVSATELPKQIELMKNDLQALHGDLERTKARNIELDTLLGDTRRQRDEAEQALSQIRIEKSEFARDLESARVAWDKLHAETTTLRTQLDQAKKERDDYGLKHMAAEDRATEAEAKLDKLREAMGIPKPSVAQPTPQPEPEPAPTAHPAQAWPEPQPIAERAPPMQVYPTVVSATPDAVPAPERIYEGQPGFNDLSHGTEAWDNTSQRYYRTA